MTPTGPVSVLPSSSTPIPLPAEGKRPAPAAVGGAAGGPVLLVLAAALAFLLASFPARNSDVLLHLARGRLLAGGQLPTANSPELAFERWGNQTWLYDLGCYLCQALLGGGGLVFAKALLAAGMALLLLRLSRSGAGWSLPAVCTCLALLSMGPHLLLQPATVSCFLLALAFWCVSRPAAGQDESRPEWISWPLLLVFVVWANVDRCFLLGLGVVALVWLGETLDEALAPRTPQRCQAALFRRALTLLLLAAACLLNPSHGHAFSFLQEWQRSAVSPFASLARSAEMPARLAYFLLLALSLLSFPATLPRWRWRHFLPWLGLALASALEVRAIPFFAVVAGPVLAWNLHDTLARHFAWARGEAEPTGACRLGRALAVVLLLVLVVCAWPGWLQEPPFGPRRWALDLPLSLQRGAETVRHWRKEGKLAAECCGAHLSADTVFAFAWFCPEEKRLLLTPQDMRGPGRQQMRADKVGYILVYDTSRERLAASLGDLVADPEQYPLLSEDGGLAVFGWRDPAQPESAERFRDWQLDLSHLAFHPADDRKAPSEAPNVQQPTRSWWEAFWKPAPPATTDGQEAQMHLLHAVILQILAPRRHASRWENSQVAGLVGAAANGVSPAALGDIPLRLALFRPLSPDEGGPAEPPSALAQAILGMQRSYAWNRDDVPPPSFYLAVRAARRAVAANPDDAAAYLVLGESYLGLLNATRERVWVKQLNKLLRIRQAQASTALNRAVALDPNLARAHLLLARLYQDMNYLDLALQHLQHACRLDREATPQGERSELSSARQARQEKDLDTLAHQVEKRETQLTLTAQGRSTRDRPFLAFQAGLAGKALEMLLESHLASFGTEGMELELELLLGTGRAHDVQEWLLPEHEALLGPASYHWFLTRAALALGDYTRTQEECVRAIQGVGLRPGFTQPMRFREGMALLVAKVLLDEQTGGGALPADLRTPFGRTEMATQIRTLAGMLRQQAELTVLRGLFALEEGDGDEAEAAFRDALAVWKDRATTDSGGGLDFNGRGIAAICLGWLTWTADNRQER